MYRSILVGYDGREHSRDALALAELLADTSGAKLTVSGVFPFPGWIGPSVPATERGLLEFKRRVDEAARSVDAASDVVQWGSPAQGLHEFAEEIDADLIVVGSSERGMLGQVLAGSTARALLHAGPCAVAVAPVGYRDSARSLRVLAVGIDGSNEAKEAVRAAVELAEAAHATVRLLAAGDPPDTGPTRWGALDTTGIMHEQFREYLDDAVRLVPDELRPSSQLIPGRTVPALLAEAEKGVDLLCVGSRGYGPIRRVLLGSTAAGLIESAPCPVLVVPRSARRSVDTKETEGVASR